MTGSPSPPGSAKTRSLAQECLAGGGEMGALMRAFDWTSTPVGGVDQWPQSLKTSLSTCLNSRFAILIWWGPELVKFYNDAYRQILGQKHPKALGAPGRDVWREIWHIIGPMLDAVMQRGEATRADDLLLELDRNGYPEECYFTFSYSPIRDESGKVAGVFTPVQETTDRVIGERRLRTLSGLGTEARAANAKSVEEVCRLAVETLALNPFDIPFAALWLNETEGFVAHCTAGMDPGAGILHEAARAAEAANSTEAVLLPLDSAAVLPQGAWPIPPKEAIVLPIMLSGQRAGFLMAGVSPRKRLDAAYRDFFLMVAGAISTAVAEARAAEDEHRRAESLAEIDRAKTAFFSNVSHEFRTPLMLMLAPADDALADTSAPLSDAHRERLETIQRNGLRLRKLVDNLLDFSRIEAGRIQASYEPTDLAELTAELASTFRSAIEKAGMRLVVDCPAIGEPVYVDRGMWEKIVLNLLSNAFKYTLQGTIAVSLRSSSGQAVLSVSDTGIGISESELPRIFERFHRVEGARGRSVEGTGIGLALVHELVNLHGGVAKAGSVPGEGSTFVVSIPLGSGHLPQDRVRPAERTRSHITQAKPYAEEALRWLPAAPADQTSRTADVRSAARPRIVLADDNADMRAYIVRLLAPSYDVEAVADGREALERVRSQRPDLLLCDVMMPGLDGFELLEKLRADPATKTLPVILLSARAGEEARVEGLARGADDYVTKPFTARELLARVEGRIELSRVRQDALRKVAEGRTLLDTIIANTPTAIALLRGSDYRFELVNPAYQDLAPGKTILGRTVSEVWPEIIDQVRPILDRVLETGEPYEAADTAYAVRRSPDGPLETRHFSFSYVRVPLPNAGEPGLLSASIDTTDRVSAQEALRATNERINRVLASITDGYYLLDADWRFVDANPVAARLVGLSTTDLIGRDLRELVGLPEQDAGLQKLGEAMATRRPVHFEYPSRVRPGNWSEVHVYPRDGGVEVYFRDITDRKRSEEAMRESQERFRRLFEANIVGIICADENRIFEANDAFLALTGYTREEMKEGLAWRAMTPPEFLPRDDAAIAEMFETGSFKPFEKDYIRKDGSRVPVLLGGAMLQRSPIQFLCFIVDLAERKLLERRILEAQKFESLGLMAGGIAHDFNNLLVGVMGNASLAMELLPNAHPALEMLDSVVSASEHAALLTRQMLAYSGKGRFVIDFVNLTQTVEEIIGIVQPSISKKIVLRTEFDRNLPRIEADPGQMQQIATNLVLNAAEAIGDAPGTITLSTGRQVLTAAEIRGGLAGAEIAPGAYVYLRVEDTGSGMDAATRQRIFDPFFTTKFTGRGLGLAAVAGILRSHKGAVVVTSAPGEGSSFTVYLPASAQEVFHAEPAEPVLEELRGTGTVLLVDDEAVVRQIARRALERYGYQVLSADSGLEAIEILRGNAGRIRVVLLDLSMPGMGGVETLVELRKIDPGVCVLLSSGYNEAETMRQFVGLDVEGFIQKPYTSQQLARKMKAVVAAGAPHLRNQ